jgi:hypothetical protein
LQVTQQGIRDVSKLKFKEKFLIAFRNGNLPQSGLFIIDMNVNVDRVISALSRVQIVFI